MKINVHTICHFLVQNLPIIPGSKMGLANLPVCGSGSVGSGSLAKETVFGFTPPWMKSFQMVEIRRPASAQTPVMAAVMLMSYGPAWPPPIAAVQQGKHSSSKPPKLMT